MKVAILAGGYGSRLQEETGTRPKPMVEVGGKPILWHIMNIYAHYGHEEFALALGYKSEVIKEYFLDFYAQNNNLKIDLATGNADIEGRSAVEWVVELIDTGKDTLTGGRIKRLKKQLESDTFMVTYGDGVADVNIEKLLEFHRSHGKIATLTAVRPPARFGGLKLKGNLVEEFMEKPQTGEGWINGGFFVLEPGVFDYIDGDLTSFERKPLERLAQEGQLAAFEHDGFFQPMDTIRDRNILEDLWASGKAPWKVWK